MVEHSRIARIKTDRDIVRLLANRMRHKERRCIQAVAVRHTDGVVPDVLVQSRRDKAAAKQAADAQTAQVPRSCACDRDGQTAQLCGG